MESQTANSQRLLCSEDEDLLEDIRLELEKHRGSQLPNYDKHTVIEIKIKDFVTRCRDPVFNSLSKVICSNIWLQINDAAKKKNCHFL